MYYQEKINIQKTCRLPFPKLSDNVTTKMIARSIFQYFEGEISRELSIFRPTKGDELPAMNLVHARNLLLSYWPRLLHCIAVVVGIMVI